MESSLVRLFLWFHQSSSLGKVGNIPLEISHWMVFLPLLAGNLPLLLLMGAIYFCILLHELGHAFIIQWFGFSVDKIELSFFGGFTKISETSTILHFARKPKKEILMALAGPSVNLLLALIFAGFHGMFKSWFFYALASVNLILGLINLLPIFPLDGGRILRAIFCQRGMSYLEATEKTFSIGNFFLVAFGIYAFFSLNIFWMIFCFLLYFLGRGELVRALQIETLLSGNSYSHAPWNGGFPFFHSKF
jgi:Zn-dependent protease